MGKKGPLTIVSPDDFKERTALTLRQRGQMSQAVDRAYINYYHQRTPDNAKELRERLGEYMRAHGGSWAKCERNVASGGLMEYIFNWVSANAPRLDSGLDRRAAERIRDIEIPSARFGVLYFLSGIKLELDVAGSLIGGAGPLGGFGCTLGTLEYDQLLSRSPGGRSVGTVAGKAGRGGDIVTIGTEAVGGIRSMADKLKAARARPSVPRPAAMGPSWLPRTEAALNAASRPLSDTWDANHYLDALAYAQAGSGMPPTQLETSSMEVMTALTGDALQAIKRLAEATWRKVKAAVDAVCEKIKCAWASRYDVLTWRRLSELLKKASQVAIYYIMVNAIPYLGGAFDLGTGLFRTISDAGARLASWNDRRHIRLQAGHPEELANAIEHQMTLGFGRALTDMLKGGYKMAISVLMPGLGSLALAVYSAIEWMVRLVLRVREQTAIENFLQTARDHYEDEKRRAVKEDGVYQPNTRPGGIITDTAAFTRFFKKGCEASPLIPMLVLNSGLGGSLMTTLQLFEEDGQQSARATAHLLGGETREFDRGAMYFARLKHWSVEYMRRSGFKFLPANAQDDLMAGYLAHATGMGKNIQSHVGSRTGLGVLGAIVKA